ncbi:MULTISPECIES: ROK family transcriptional regulator [Microbacterium]|uniref:ROK family transcriptional regulator n=1 Tax=Microbacterium TaxID=33882 RepID=UPI000FF492B9|nr:MULTISPECIES: ROK family transcriptional regulator [Microbacterium]RKE64960.1 putative NBD/HSP70 family sugar kinase [Microbacterium sp. AG238]WJM15466.1 ROK family transcriptional regulator [Microbacterium arborescens]
MSVAPGTAELVRRVNLARMLVVVHRDGPISRAALTAELGLNRSTIGALTAELARLGLVTETAGAPEGRIGRPSPVITARADVVAVAVNPEVDAVTLAAVGLDRRVHARRRALTTALITPQELASLIAETIEDWRAGPLAATTVIGVGVAVPGLVEPAAGLVVHAPHLRWTNAPLAELVTAATGTPTTVGNDASYGAHAEYLFGAARGVADVIYLNGGASGIGGGLVVGGALVGGARGLAGEFGHNPAIFEDAADRRSGEHAALEDEVSRHRLIASLGLPGADDAELRAAVHGAANPAARAELRRQRRILASAVASAVNVLDPAVVVLGGFLAPLVESDVDEFAEAVARQTISAACPLVRTAELGDDRLLVGAAETAFADLLADPVPVMTGSGAPMTDSAAASSATSATR